MTCNLDKNDYYTQRNNSLYPSAACMPTSYVMFLNGNGRNYFNDTNLSDDDYFMSLLRSDKAWEYAKKNYPDLISDGYTPNEIHGMYGNYLSPIVCGGKVSRFVTDLTFNSCVERVLSGQVIMTSGKFDKLEGHAFCIIGYDGTNLILADPWGNFNSGYKDSKGYGVKMTYSDFEKHVKPTALKKWGHVII
ncbi:MAG: C39 family peptidase [Spirochaetota bacterium]|nr:C39 family peptidase [Spirochaetota bacterium]